MSFKELTPWFKEVFNLIDATCNKMGIKLYLIGAQARHFHLAEHGIRPGRGIMDIDFAIMIPDIATYDQFIETLLQKGFKKAKEAHRVIHGETNTVVDILPFGEVEEEGTVIFTDRKTELSVVGLNEVLQNPDIKELDKETVVNVTPLEGIIILKLISFDEKPERTSDLEDIHDVLIHYFELNEERFYDNIPEYVDEFSEEHFQLEAGTWLAGLDIGIRLNSNKSLKKYILNILNNEVNHNPGKISRYYYNKGYFKDIGTIKRFLKLIIRGMHES